MFKLANLSITCFVLYLASIYHDFCLNVLRCLKYGISHNFLMRKFSVNEDIRTNSLPNDFGNCAFTENFFTRKLDKIFVFYVVLRHFRSKFQFQKTGSWQVIGLHIYLKYYSSTGAFHIFC